MPIYRELVVTLTANEFSNGAGEATASIFSERGQSLYHCEFHSTVRGVPPPYAGYDSVDDARKAIFQYWDECENAFRNNGVTSFQRILKV